MNIILGTGPLGRSVMKELIARGESVRMISLKGKATLPRGVEVIKADLLNPEQASECMKGAQRVYHCAQPPYHKWTELFQTMQKNIIKGALANNAKLIVGENMYMYGNVKGVLHEDLPYAATTRKGKVRAAMSEQLIRLYKEGKLQVAIGRASDFFGAYALGSSVGERFFKPIVSGKSCSILGNIDKKHTYTYIDDFGKALVTIGDHEDAYGLAWHVPNAETITPRQFAELAYGIVGFPPAVKPMGKAMLRIGGLFIPEAKESIEMFYQFENDFIVDSSKFTKRFKQTATPLKQAVAATVEWYKQVGCGSEPYHE